MGCTKRLADDTFARAELDVEIRPGGRATPVGPELQLERCQFAIANADDVVLFRQQEMDIVAVLAAMQNHPRCIIVQDESGVESFDDLSGMTLQRQAGRGFVEFMRSRGLLDGVQEVPYHGSVASLVADPMIAIQGYSFAEPLLAEQQGVKVRTLMVSDLGFNPYSSVLITTGKLIRDRPELVRTFVQAARVGWQNYVTDPAIGNEAILSANQHGMTPEVLEFGSDGLRSLAMPNGVTLDRGRRDVAAALEHARGSDGRVRACRRGQSETGRLFHDRVSAVRPLKLLSMRFRAGRPDRCGGQAFRSQDAAGGRRRTAMSAAGTGPARPTVPPILRLAQASNR